MRSWFNSSDQVDTALVWVAVIGAMIELGVAVAAVINVHKEIEESRKKKLERYIEIFACIAAFFFFAEAILGWRSSMLLKSENLKLYAEIQPRNLTAKQKDILWKLLWRESLRSPPMSVAIKTPQLDFEARVFAWEIAGVFTNAGFNVGIDQNINVGEEPYFGLTLIINPDPSTTVRITTNAFNAAGIALDGLILDKDIPQNVIKIRVGTKLIR